MINGNSRNREMRDPEFFADFKRNILHYSAVFILQLIEPRIHAVVEDVALQQLDDFGRRVDVNGLREFAKQIVDINRQAGNVVHVRVRDNNIAHGLPLRFGKSDADAAGVNGDAVIDDKAS